MEIKKEFIIAVYLLDNKHLRGEPSSFEDEAISCFMRNPFFNRIVHNLYDLAHLEDITKWVKKRKLN